MLCVLPSVVPGNALVTEAAGGEGSAQLVTEKDQAGSRGGLPGGGDSSRLQSSWSQGVHAWTACGRQLLPFAGAEVRCRAALDAGGA